ncbi:MAG: hypothetical protein AB8G99_01930 [Planctomycetaceae bacterium]
MWLLVVLAFISFGQISWPDHRGPGGDYHLTSKTEYGTKTRIGSTSAALIDTSEKEGNRSIG